MREPKYKRVLLKISGEALAGDAHRGLDFAVIGGVCDVIRQCVEAGVQVGVVVGGGNFWRGVKDGGGKMERTRADHMGMLATVINALAVADCLEQRGVEVRVQTAIAMNQIAEPYIRSKAIRHLEKGRVVIFGCGTGNPFFSTDTGAVLRARKLTPTRSCLPRTSTACILRTPPRIPAPSNTTPSPTTRCWPAIWPSWTRRRLRFPWITIFPFRSSHSKTRRIFCAS